MYKPITFFVLCILLFSSNPIFAGDTHLVSVLDPKGDVDGCVELNKKFNELARKIVPKNHPSVRLVQATFAGSQTGLIWRVVEFDDMADMARAMMQLENNEEIAALSQEMDKSCPTISTSVGDQLYYHEGTK